MRAVAPTGWWGMLARPAGIEPAPTGLEDRLDSNTKPFWSTLYYTKQEHGNRLNPSWIEGKGCFCCTP